MSLSKIQIEKERKIGLLIIGENNVLRGSKIAEELRDENLNCDLIIGKDLKKNMIKANKGEYNFVIIIGDNEIKNGKYILKNLQSGEQNDFSADEIKKFFH